MKKDRILLLVAEIQRPAREQAFVAIVSTMLTLEFCSTISGSKLVHHVAIYFLGRFRCDGHLYKPATVEMCNLTS